MITVTAAIIEKNGLLFAARRKADSHLAGLWEFPGGKLEAGETEEQCLARELKEEFGIECVVGDFFAESIYDYGVKVVRLLSYHVRHKSGSFQCRDHDQVAWLPIDQLPSLNWAPADIPLVEKLLEDHHIAKTFAYYRDNAEKYVKETVDFDFPHQIRQNFLQLLPVKSHILDLGCGSGRDSRYFLDQGFRVTPVDAVKEIAISAEHYLGCPVRVQKAEELTEQETYDGIWASASLLHIPRSQILVTFDNIITALKPEGIWYMSFKKGKTECKDHMHRFFNNYNMEMMQQLLEQFPQLQIVELSESSSMLRGKKQQWLNILVKKK